ncbi:MAG: zinc-dependent metalloprotease, partial [Ekhidna sp.]
PHPYVKMDEQGNIDLSEAYDDKIGDWDKVTIKYGYGDFPGGENEERLDQILNDAFDNDLRYITDQDARPASGLHPEAHLWDNGTNAAVELNRMMKIRRAILNKFSEKAIRSNMPMSSIEEVLVPMYLFHRYQVDGTSKIIGGLNYSYALRGGNQVVTEMLSFDEQMGALEALLNTVKVENLKLPENLLGQIPPRAFGHPRSRETFQSKTGPAFDYLAAVETAASVPFSFILNADRFNRLLTYKARDNSQPGVDAVLDRMIKAVWMSPSHNSLDRTIQQVVEMEMLKHLMGLAINDRAYDEVRAKATAKIKEIRSYANSRNDRKTNDDGTYYRYVVAQIDRFLAEPEEFKMESPIQAPDGSPIGSCDF